MKRQTKKVSPAVAQAKAIEKAVVTSAAAEPNPQYLIDVNKRYGAGSVMVLGSEGVVAGVVPIPSGLPSLDAALGVGGLAEGRLVEIFGMESSGKTSLALIFLGQAQKLGRLAGFIDAEHALDPAYAKKLGVDVTRLLISQPSCGEEALEIAETMIVEGGVRFIVVDSVAALVPKAEIEGDMGDIHVGLLARLMSQAMRKLTGVASKHGATVVFLNQIRMKIGVMFGNPETTTGGNALRFFASQRLELRREAAIKDDAGQAIGSRVKVTVVKNKVAAPFRTASVDLRYAWGLDRESDVLDVAEKAGIVQRSGAWYSYGEVRLGQGREQAAAYLRENPALVEELVGKLP
jgi:recombination protein RecA